MYVCMREKGKRGYDTEEQTFFEISFKTLESQGFLLQPLCVRFSLVQWDDSHYFSGGKEKYRLQA